MQINNTHKLATLRALINEARLTLTAIIGIEADADRGARIEDYAHYLGRLKKEVAAALPVASLLDEDDSELPDLSEDLLKHYTQAPENHGINVDMITATLNRAHGVASVCERLALVSLSPETTKTSSDIPDDFKNATWDILGRLSEVDAMIDIADPGETPTLPGNLLEHTQAA